MKRFHSEHFSQNDLWFPSSGVFLAIAQAEEAGPVPAGSENFTRVIQLKIQTEIEQPLLEFAKCRNAKS